jgi:hypothetical protein
VVGIRALWVQWVGMELKHVGKLKLGKERYIWHIEKGNDRRIV